MGHMLTLQSLKDTGAVPKLFGLGFIQLKIDDDTRIHFYHPSLSAAVAEEELHDHRYDFTSTVLKGKLTNEIWTFAPDPDGEQEMIKVSCEPGVPVPDDEVAVRGRAVKSLNFETGPGSSYTITHTQFHRVSGDDCITLITRKPKAKPFATVIKDINAESVCPFSVSMSEEACWDLIGEMLGEPASPGYHVRTIARGLLGEPSKIREEAEEFQDAIDQGVEIMALIELSDLQGAICAYLERHHPSINLADLQKMSAVTRRAFENGHRS